MGGNGKLPPGHRDPFDRMLAAQSVMEELPIASIDEALSSLGAPRFGLTQLSRVKHTSEREFKIYQ